MKKLSFDCHKSFTQALTELTQKLHHYQRPPRARFQRPPRARFQRPPRARFQRPHTLIPPTSSNTVDTEQLRKHHQQPSQILENFINSLESSSIEKFTPDISNQDWFMELNEMTHFGNANGNGNSKGNNNVNSNGNGNSKGNNNVNSNGNGNGNGSHYGELL